MCTYLPIGLFISTASFDSFITAYEFTQRLMKIETANVRDGICITAYIILFMRKPVKNARTLPLETDLHYQFFNFLGVSNSYPPAPERLCS